MSDAGVPRLLARNGRTLAWMERGAPDGFPVFYAHGNPGSRLELLFLDRKAEDYGLRLIALDRPGFGQSDFVSEYGLLDYAADVEYLADHLGVLRFGLLGWSSGGPAVLAAACQMPQRVAFVVSVSGYTNFGECPQAESLMKNYNLRGPELSERRPELFSRVVKLARWVDRTLPNVYLKMAASEMSGPDRQILRDRRVAELFMRNQQESVAQGVDGVIQDLETQWAPWPFLLADIGVPVSLFQGQKDTFVPWLFATHLQQSINGAELTLFEDQGHLYILSPVYQDRIFRNILRHAD
ncbi:alpha/beta fold hydrolase [Marinobacter mobilis]|uniref:Pimeloyl-ACP methyl ester carboxylesterase n=1 Tax=Marinobacter mobilis TaxID=488533 RepID=A0A1H2SLM4_9GAMM|nr:alpha/beta hydrolase [Marinobacter mobilis]SDW32365.1 Pimeloyl-ACP methyl ester carboxylesterase [Marinobacter mobilis]